MIPTFRVAIIPGDGISKKVMPEGLCATQAAAERFDLQFEYHIVDWVSCDYYQQHGQMTPDDQKAQLRSMDVIFFGMIDWPATVSDHVSLWGSLLKFRRKFDQYTDPRPMRLFEGVPCPLADRKPDDIDYYAVCKNTGGEHVSLGGIMYEGTDREVMTQKSAYSRKGAERLLGFAFDLAQSRQRRYVTLTTESSGIAISMS